VSSRFGNVIRFVAIPLLFSAPHVQASSYEPKAGDVFQIVQTYETSKSTNGDSSSSSGGKSALIERVIRVDQGGVELEYDEPPEADGKRKGLNWQLPARIYRPANGTPILLNSAELEKRVDPWLKKAKMQRAACGQWIFTWNAFKIECDPASALGIVEQFNLWSPNMAEGQLFSDSSSIAAVPLKVKSYGANGSVYVAELEVDPEKVKKQKAETDVLVSKIMGKTKSFESALAEQANHKISGTILVTIEAGPSGQTIKRTTITRFRIEADGAIETGSNSVTLERRPLSSAAVQNLSVMAVSDTAAGL
jgi:hypothetical protein